VGQALANPSPWGAGSQNSFPLSLMERARVRVKSVLHRSIQQRLYFLGVKTFSKFDSLSFDGKK